MSRWGIFVLELLVRPPDPTCRGPGTPVREVIGIPSDGVTTTLGETQESKMSILVTVNRVHEKKKIWDLPSSVTKRNVIQNTLVHQLSWKPIVLSFFYP